MHARTTSHTENHDHENEAVGVDDPVAIGSLPKKSKGAASRFSRAAPAASRPSLLQAKSDFQFLAGRRRRNLAR